MKKPNIVLILAAGGIGLAAARFVPGRDASHVARAAPRNESTATTSKAKEGPRRRRDLNSPERAAWVASRKAMIATTEASFQAEVRDDAWSSEKASTLRDAAGTMGALGGTLRAVECRSKTCRVEMRDDPATSAEFHRFVRACTRTFPKIIADHVDEPQGKASYVLYLTSEAT